MHAYSTHGSLLFYFHGLLCSQADYFLKDYEAVAGPLATWIKKKDTAIHEIVRRGKALKARVSYQYVLV